MWTVVRTTVNGKPGISQTVRAEQLLKELGLAGGVRRGLAQRRPSVKM
jgi:hypothetical protein